MFLTLCNKDGYQTCIEIPDKEPEQTKEEYSAQVAALLGQETEITGPNESM